MRKDLIVGAVVVFLLGACASSVLAPTGSRVSRAGQDWTYETAMNTLKMQGALEQMRRDLAAVRDDVSSIKAVAEGVRQ